MPTKFLNNVIYLNFIIRTGIEARLCDNNKGACAVSEAGPEMKGVGATVCILQFN